MAIDLNQIKIASPCKMNWNEMKGDDRIRHCGSCKMNVYSLAGLTRKEAQELLQKAAGGERICLRMRRRADGTVITKDCPVGVSAVRRARLKIASLMATLVSGAMWFSSQKSSASQPTASTIKEPIKQPEPRQMMGKIALPQREMPAVMGGIGPSSFHEPLNQVPPQPTPRGVEPEEVDFMGDIAPEESPDASPETYKPTYHDEQFEE